MSLPSSVGKSCVINFKPISFRPSHKTKSSDVYNNPKELISKRVSGSAVSLVTRLRAGRYGLRKPVAVKHLPFLQSVQTDFGAQPRLIFNRVLRLFSASKVAGA
jgi:hypothetical protein